MTHRDKLDILRMHLLAVGVILVTCKIITPDQHIIGIVGSLCLCFGAALSIAIQFIK